MGAPVPFEYLIWKLVFETGWTLEYIQTLPLASLYEYLQIKDGMAKVQKT